MLKIDRCANQFVHILNCYRTGILTLPPGTSWDSIQSELDFYQIPDGALPVAIQLYTKTVRHVDDVIKRLLADPQLQAAAQAGYGCWRFGFITSEKAATLKPWEVISIRPCPSGGFQPCDEHLTVRDDARLTLAETLMPMLTDKLASKGFTVRWIKDAITTNTLPLEEGGTKWHGSYCDVMEISWMTARDHTAYA
ncbi:hypothetical protein WJX72_004799 [[Myrmecia] bisecta]|uniref:Potassium channel tetramerisation-type BTB domain-containing protein n=1 Tax=[Myrmecia] bisecta TaxID=41462 RepID=A0AAW1PX59_9CHLO